MSAAIMELKMREGFGSRAVAIFAALVVAPMAASQAPTTSALPPGPGHDTMVKVCSACHSPEIAATQRLSPAGWDELVETMVSRGAQATDAEVAEIKAYLRKSFPDTPAQPAPPSK
jgi:mono/diheme cytochrome c family protein